MSYKRVTVLLTCKHSIDFDKAHTPKIFEDCFCFRCNKSVYVESVLPHWHNRCAEKNCRFGVYYGQDETTCKRKAIEHANSKSHVVRVLYGTDLKETVGSGMTVDDRLGLRAVAAQQSAILRGITDRRATTIVTVSLPDFPSLVSGFGEE
jgi:hypothetical protein